jgi:hypothetical protein
MHHKWVQELDLSGNRLDGLDEAMDVLLCLPNLTHVMLEVSATSGLSHSQCAAMHTSPNLEQPPHYYITDLSNCNTLEQTTPI